MISQARDFCILAILTAISSASAEGPCDIYAAANTPCVAAHSTVRALFKDYSGNLYQVRRADGTTKDIPVEKAGGYVKISVQDNFCSGSSCTISIIYDQTSYHNNLVKSPKVYWLSDGGKEANASAGETWVNGRKAHGIYVTAWSKIAYRNNSTKGIATGNQAEAMYMVVDGKRYSSDCCFDYGNAETSGNDDGNGTMEAVYWGTDVGWGGYGQGNGPWIAADLENGMFKGNAGYWQYGNTHKTPWPTAQSVIANYATAMLKGPSDNTFALKAGNAQNGKLITMWDSVRPTPNYSPKKLQGAIILGTGGDGSNGGAGTFFEGAMTIGNPPDSIDDKIQANIVAAGYGSTVEKADPVPQAPYKDTISIPGTLEAENYDVGGQDVSYYDTDDTTQGKVYREDGVDVVSTTDSYAVGYTVAGEWLEYTVNVAKAGAYAFEATVASGSKSSSFQLFLDSAAITDTVKVDSASWTTYSAVSGTTKTLAAGTHVLKIAITGSYVNIDKITFSDGTTHIAASPASRLSAGTYRIFDVQGIYLGNVSINAAEAPGIQVHRAVKHSGLYILKARNFTAEVQVNK